MTIEQAESAAAGSLALLKSRVPSRRFNDRVFGLTLARDSRESGSNLRNGASLSSLLVSRSFHFFRRFPTLQKSQLKLHLKQSMTRLNHRALRENFRAGRKMSASAVFNYFYTLHKRAYPRLGGLSARILALPRLFAAEPRAQGCL